MARPQAILWTNDGQPLPEVGYDVRVRQRLEQDGFAPRIVHCPERALSRSELLAPCHILTGGSTSTDANVAWMKRALDQLSDVVDRARRGQATVVGICLGAQMIAHVIAGKPVARRASTGIEVGLARVKPVNGRVDEWVVPEFHYEEIAPEFLELEGIVHLLRNDHSDVQAYSAFHGITGYQFHPEFADTDARRLIEVHQSLIADTGGAAKSARRQTAELAALWRPETFHELVTRNLLI